MDYITEKLDKALHDRNLFDCGVAALNTYLKMHASQNQIKNFSNTYVATSATVSVCPKIIAGFYTLSAGQVDYAELPREANLNLPKYAVPVARIGRLATDINFRGEGLGSFLLHDALKKILEVSKRIGIYAVLVDAKNDEAKSFYQKYGFMTLQESALT